MMGGDIQKLASSVAECAFAEAQASQHYSISSVTIVAY